MIIFFPENGAAAAHIEDQEDGNKRCGHRPNKSIVDTDEMIDRLKIATKTAKESYFDNEFVIIARTDAYANEGIDGLLKRCDLYINKGGADMLFPEALTDLETYYKLNEYLGGEIPILANITEFALTPLFNINELYESGVSMVLYPLSAHRAMAKAAFTVYESIINNGDQKKCLDLMQTRDDLYKTLDYCLTKMGKRLLRSSLFQPLCHRLNIQMRQNVVASFIDYQENAYCSFFSYCK